MTLPTCQKCKAKAIFMQNYAFKLYIAFKIVRNCFFKLS